MTGQIDSLISREEKSYKRFAKHMRDFHGTQFKTIFKRIDWESIHPLVRKEILEIIHKSLQWTMRKWKHDGYSPIPKYCKHCQRRMMEKPDQLD